MKTSAQTEREKRRDFNLMLKKYIIRKSYISFNRTVCEQEEDFSGFILAMSKNFLLVQLDNKFSLDGFCVIRLDDFNSVRHSSYERARRKIFNAEGLLTNQYGFDKDLPLTSWADIFKKLQGYDIHVIVENINKNVLDYWIGPIARVSEASVSIRNCDPAGMLDKKPTVIKFDTISSLQFGDRYSTTLKKYLRERK